MTTSEFIKKALDEDIGDGDHTSLATITANKHGKAKLIVKDNGIIAGITLAREIFKEVDPELAIELNCNDGDPVRTGAIAFSVSGKIRSILMAERLVLNCMQRMSGIASNTQKYVDAVSGYDVKIMDTRKTTPLLRAFEKEAVRIGGGYNHRFGLFDMILIKDNHIDACGGILPALKAARDYKMNQHRDLPIEVETRNLEDVSTALSSEIPDRIMFDNFSVAETKEAVKLVSSKVQTESSGGITLDNIREYASTGVNCISVGALTHSVKSMDLSLKIF